LILKTYTRLRRNHTRDAAEKFASEFVLKLLKQRLFSSPAAFAMTLPQHERTLHTVTRGKAAPKPAWGILRRQIDRVDEDYATDTAAEEATMTQSQPPHACSASKARRKWPSCRR
jgi:hypothetical protein